MAKTLMIVIAFAAVAVGLFTAAGCENSASLGSVNVQNRTEWAMTPAMLATLRQAAEKGADLTFNMTVTNNTSVSEGGLMQEATNPQIALPVKPQPTTQPTGQTGKR